MGNCRRTSRSNNVKPFKFIGSHTMKILEKIKSFFIGPDPNEPEEITIPSGVAPLASIAPLKTKSIIIKLLQQTMVIPCTETHNACTLHYR